MQRFAVPVVGIAASILLLRYAPLAGAWLAFLWAALCCRASLRGPTTAVKALWFNLAIALIVVGSCEIYLGRPYRDPNQLVYSPGYTVEHEILGYAPQPGQTAQSTRTHLGEVVFDVTYSIDADGLRQAPPHTEEPGPECILFFGGSVTFGEGVEDSETMPYQTGIATAGRYRIYNFGFHGYGPHQMLAALETGWVDDIIDCLPKYAFYLAIFDHVSRAAGPRPWDLHGPRFVLNRGKVERRGHFDDGSTISPAVWEWLEKSMIVRAARQRAMEADARDVDLYVGIVDAARRRFEGQYAGSEFHVLQWGQEEGMAQEAWKALEDRGIRIHRYAGLLPEAALEWRSYTISEHDLHPNSRAHGQLARFVSGVVDSGDE